MKSVVNLDRIEGVNLTVICKKGRNNYDGKPYTSSYSILETIRIDNDRNHMGPYFTIKNGKLEQWGPDNLDNSTANPQEPTVIFRKVPSNYNPWQ